MAVRSILDVVISTRGAERLRSGHPWIYRSDVLSSEAGPGDLVRVVSERKRVLGTAMWSSASQISLRMIAGDERPLADEAGWLRTRVAAAAAYRAELAIDATAWRLIHADADGLPALVVDRYGTEAGVYLVVQALNQGMDRRIDAIVKTLVDVVAPAGILLRHDVKVRQLEGLELHVTVAWGDVPPAAFITEHGVRLGVDLRHGQKTGLFLDQRENHALAGACARGRALDTFAYHGGFALQMARRAEHVLALDSSGPALEAIRANAAANAIRNVETREANVFDELRELEIARARFDTIVLDPPAFVKTRASIDRGAAGYKEINLRALKLLTPGGMLLTCSCSHHIDALMFEDIVTAAASDARAHVVLTRRLIQASDHPVLLGVPETSYLKGLLVRKTGTW